MRKWVILFIYLFSYKIPSTHVPAKRKTKRNQLKGLIGI